jgi:hypothetical protein
MNDPEYSTWLTTSQAAARLGISERAVQKRCTSGKLTARRTDDGRWEIAADSLPRTGEPNRTRTNRTGEPQDGNRANLSTIQDANEPNLGRERTEPDANQFTRMEAEVLFLRSMVEQHQRSEAELRAALREALRAMPKAIEAAAQSTLQTSREDAPGRAESVPASKHTPEASSNKQRQPETRGNGLQKIRDGLRVLLGFKR